MSGTLTNSNVPSVSNVVAISFSTEFFAPGTWTVPLIGPEPRTTNVSVSAPVLITPSMLAPWSMAVAS